MQIVSTTLYPRLTPFRLPTGEAVTVVGQVLSLNETYRTLTLQPDLESNFTIEVNLPESLECAELRNIKFLQVRGMTEANNVIALKEYCNFKDNFDLKTYNEVLKLTADSSFRHIFGNRA